MNRLGISALGLFVGPALLLAGCGEEKKAEKPVIRAVKTIVAKTVPASENRRIAGLVEAVNRTELAFQVAGTISAVRVKAGDTVRKGQELARLDDRQYGVECPSRRSAGA